MRVILKDLSTGLFAMSGSQWTPDSRNAFDFGNGDRVIEEATRLRIPQAATCYCFEDSKNDLVIPFRPQVDGTSSTKDTPSSPPGPGEKTHLSGL
ncbi:MAG TPA: hypothetical protein VEH04_13440 [Verrucomicrobiae bacterium]|nr:hypothetical protein [Verrucomicrobiae bacterium]